VDVKVTSRFDEFGGLVLPGSPAEFGTFIAKDTDKWGKVVKFAGLKAD
jgi:tripartite-type tricarboxylate transporter receptor subunit TctC